MKPILFVVLFLSVAYGADTPTPLTQAEKNLGCVKIGRAMDGREIAYYENGSYSYRKDIDESRSR